MDIFPAFFAALISFSSSPTKAIFLIPIPKLFCAARRIRGYRLKHSSEGDTSNEPSYRPGYCRRRKSGPIGPTKNDYKARSSDPALFLLVILKFGLLIGCIQDVFLPMNAIL